MKKKRVKPEPESGWAPVHPSHSMKDAGVEILAPAGTARFYGVRRCVDCGGRQYRHAAGAFVEPELEGRCMKGCPCGGTGDRSRK